MSVNNVQPVKKRRRTELACTICRRRKHRCDGKRPQCGPCRQKERDCVYEPLVPSNDADAEQNSSPQATITITNNNHHVVNTPVSPQIITREDANARLDELPPLTQLVEIVEDVLIDVLATATFNETADPGVEYFGPSSNHAMFRSLSFILVEMSRAAGAGEVPNNHSRRLEMTEGEGEDERQLQDAPVPLHADQQHVGGHRKDPAQGRGCQYHLPRHQQLILLVNQYMATVGVVRPYVDKSTIMSEYHLAARQSPPRFRRGFLSLLSIVCALALSTLDDADAETYYHQSLDALDLGSSRGLNIEIVQALLLIITYQQNNQRSVTSWTIHALAVKAALQQGVHSPTVRSRQNRKTSDLMERLWIGIMFNDLMIGMTLGRPGLIHPRLLQCQRIPKTQNVHFADRMNPIETVAGQEFLISMASSSTMLSDTIECMYNYNMELPEEKENLDDLLQKYNRLAESAQAWRNSLSSFGGLISITELKDAVDGSYESMRLRILLSIHNHRISMMMIWPLLSYVLKSRLESSIDSDRDTIFARTDFTTVARRAWHTTSELGEMIEVLIKSSEAFLHSNAAWFSCNYTHVRTALEQNLANMKLLEVSNLMTYKSCRCLWKLLGAFDIISDKRTRLDTSENKDILLSHFIQSSTDDFLHISGGDDFFSLCGGNYSNDSWF